MIWNVYWEDFNNRAIVKYNIFNHGGFAQDVNKLLKEDTTKDEFTEQLKRSLRYYFQGKSEYEVVITSWPVYINRAELDRLNTEYQEYNNKWGHYPYNINIIPNVGEKIDIYSQVMMNFDIFVDMIWREKNDASRSN